METAAASSQNVGVMATEDPGAQNVGVWIAADRAEKKQIAAGPAEKKTAAAIQMRERNVVMTER